MLEIKIYKNWKEVCESMNWKSTGGDTKNKNLKILESLCNYEKQGNKYIIKEIYKEQKEIIDRRKIEGSISNDIQFCILHLLSQEDNSNMIVSKSKLLRMTGLVNNQFNSINNNKNLYASNRNMNYDTVNKTLERAYAYTSQYLQRAIKSLENKLLISVSKDIMYINIDEKEAIEDNDTGNIKGLITNNTYREATQKERKYILKVQKDVLNEFGYKSIDEVTFFELNNVRANVNRILKGKGINYFYYCYDIVGNDRYIKEEYEELKDKMNNSVNTINNNMCDLINKSMNTKADKLIKKSKILEDIIDENNLNIEESEDNEKLFDILCEKDIQLSEILSKSDTKYNEYLLDSNFKKDVKTTINDSMSLSHRENINWNNEYKKHENKIKNDIELIK